MRKSTLNLVLAAILLTTAFPLLNPPAVRGGVTLTVLTRHDTTIQAKYETAFLNSQLAGEAGVTAIVWKGLAAPFWRQTIEAGGIDVAWGGGPTLFDTLAGASLLLDMRNAPAVMEEVAQIDDTIAGAPMKRYDAQGNLVWTAAAISTFGFTVNKDTLSQINIARAAEGRPPMPTPQSWEDLGEPIYFEDPQAIGIVNAPDSTSNTRVYEIILQAFDWAQGWKLITLTGANSNIYHGSTEALMAVIEGAVGIALTIDFYGFYAQQANSQCELIIPPGLSIVNGDPIAITNPNPQQSPPPARGSAAAEAFVKFVLSKEGQAVWLDPTPSLASRLPVREDAFDTPQGQQRPDLHDAFDKAKTSTGIEFSDPLALSYEQSLLWYFEATITNPHADLVTAWSSVSRVKDVDEAAYASLADQMGSVLLSQDDAISINGRMDPLVDDAFRLQKMNEWETAARAKYQQAKQQADAILQGTTTTTQPTTSTSMPASTSTTTPVPMFPSYSALTTALLTALAAVYTISRRRRLALN